MNKTKEIPDKDSYEPKVFDPGAKKMLLPEFEKRYYTPILDKIDSELKDGSLIEKIMQNHLRIIFLHNKNIVMFFLQNLMM